jgi:hypothetical protein
MYKTEEGHWTLLEPLVSSNTKIKKEEMAKLPGTKHYFGKTDVPITADYIPHYLFNDCHLWGVMLPGQNFNFQDDLQRRKRWIKFNPKFAGEVHKGILKLALKDAPANVRKEIDRYYSRAILGFIGPIVDQFDRGKYNPLIHFDNCYIKEGWDLVNENLKKFKNQGDLNAFFCASHAIADFYAHSSYVHFAKIIQQPNKDDDYPDLYNPVAPAFETVPAYSKANPPVIGFDLTGNRFSVNKKYWKGPDKSIIANYWGGKVISGRYAQPDDTWKGVESFITEGILSVIPDTLLKDPHFSERGWVPHHNEIAVDNLPRPASHTLYNDTRLDRLSKISYENQFKWRKNAAVRHIRKVFEENKKP